MWYSVLNVPPCHTEWVKVNAQNKKQERKRDTWCDEPHLGF